MEESQGRGSVEQEPGSRNEVEMAKDAAYWPVSHGLLPFSLLNEKFNFIYVYNCFACVHVCVPHGCLVLMESRRGHPIPWHWSYRQIWATMWILGLKPGSSRRAASIYSSLISPGLPACFLTPPRTTCIEVPLPIAAWALPHQSLTKTVPWKT